MQRRHRLSRSRDFDSVYRHGRSVSIARARAAARAVARWEDQDFVGQVSPSSIMDVGRHDEPGPLIGIIDFAWQLARLPLTYGDDRIRLAGTHPGQSRLNACTLLAVQ